MLLAKKKAYTHPLKIFLQHLQFYIHTLHVQDTEKGMHQFSHPKKKRREKQVFGNSKLCNDQQERKKGNYKHTKVQYVFEKRLTI